MKRLLFFLLLILLIPKILVLTSGCAQIIAPTGGTRDTIPPTLIDARPQMGSTNFTGNRITLNFDEYILLDQLRENLLVSPTPKNDPYVDFKLKTVTIKLRDTLEPNTTYAIDLGNAIRDNNENNILRNFSYVFSTGRFIDTLKFEGNVKVAESGIADSTLQVYLYKDLDDSAVHKFRPKYIARLDSSGNFTFKNLSPGLYNVFALKDGDGGKTYNSTAEMFGFADSIVNVNSITAPVNLYAYIEEKEKPRIAKTSAPIEKKLKYSTKIPTEKQDILNDLTIEFNKPLKNFDRQKILLTDTLYNIYSNAVITIDSTFKKIIVNNKWLPDSLYELIILKDIGSDSTGLVLAKSDTIRFKTKKETDYGSIRINFINFDKSKNPVLQFIKSDIIVKSYPLTLAKWSAPLFEPGEYELRILYDKNNNGFWDQGNYHKKLQPEKVYSLPQKLNIKANWENERDIELPLLF
ncbi:MAG: Ig-like domain-containing domain [Ginsengibacter sp.]